MGLKDRKVSYVQGCLDNEQAIEEIREAIRFDRLIELLDIEADNRQRIDAIERKMGGTDADHTAKALSEGAVYGTVQLLSELADCKHVHDEKYEKIKAKINELIEWLS